MRYVTCNEWEGKPYTTLMCRFVPTFLMTFIAIIAIMYQELISSIVHQVRASSAVIRCSNTQHSAAAANSLPTLAVSAYASLIWL